MKNVTLIIVSLLLLSFLVFGLIAFSDTDNYKIETPKGHVTYMISILGDFMPKHYDTILVFGHGDNELVAREITEFLNKTDPRQDPFSYRIFDPK